MNKSWPTQLHDIILAEQIMSRYAASHAGVLSLFELTVDKKEKVMDFRLSAWVMALTSHFTSLYGAKEGEWITRRVISHCMRDNQTLH